MLYLWNISYQTEEINACRACKRSIHLCIRLHVMYTQVILLSMLQSRCFPTLGWNDQDQSGTICEFFNWEPLSFIAKFSCSIWSFLWNSESSCSADITNPLLLRHGSEWLQENCLIFYILSQKYLYPAVTHTCSSTSRFPAIIMQNQANVNQIELTCCLLWKSP